MGEQETRTTNELLPHASPYRLTKTGFEIQRATTPEEWEAAGEGLRLIDEAKQWAIGDWLVDGKTHYGDGLYARAKAVSGYEEDALRHLKSLADRFELCSREHNVSWKHYQTVAPIKAVEEKDGKLQLSDEYDTNGR